MKNKKQVGKALGRVASGLYVVTTKFEDKEDAILASWVNHNNYFDLSDIPSLQKGK